MTYLKNNIYKILLWLFIVTYIAYFSFFSILRYKTLYVSYYDLGIMHQTVYNTYKAIVDRDPSRVLEMTDTDSPNQIKRMAIHTDFTLALLAPFYFIHAGPETLLVIQTVVVALGAWFVFQLTSEILKKVKYKERLALLFTFSYLLYPALERANMFDFHSVTMASTFLLAMFYFWLKNKYKLSLVFFFLSITTKEQVALTTCFFGLYTIYSSYILKKTKKNIYYSLAIIGFSIFWFVFTVFYIIPLFRGSDHFAIKKYADFGDSPSNIIIGVLKNPFNIARYVVSTDAMRYLLNLLGPVAFLSLLSPVTLLISAPEFVINLLSKDSNLRNIFYHYTAVITPFIFIAAIYGSSYLLMKLKNKMKLVIGIVILTTIFFSWWKGPLPFAKDRQIHPIKYPMKEANDVIFWANILKDEKLKISTTGHLAPFFTARRYFYDLSENYHVSDYILLRTSEVYDSPEKNELIPVYTILQKDVRFEIIYKKGELEVYKRINF